MPALSFICLEFPLYLAVRSNLPTVESPWIVLFAVLREAGLAVPASHY
jgi:hypothetical protein